MNNIAKVFRHLPISENGFYMQLWSQENIMFENLYSTLHNWITSEHHCGFCFDFAVEELERNP